MPSIAIVAGEASGDASGAALIQEIRKLRPDITFWGAGGHKMREAGVEMVADFSWAGAIGIVESLKLVPRLLVDLARLKKVFLDRKPDVFIPIDFGAFNVKLGKFAREQGITSVYYFPPGSWRRRLKNPSKLLDASDRIITPFPWSATLLSQAGADVVFPGHPMLDRVAPVMSKEQFLGGLGIKSDAKVVGFLPGSRPHEICNILPALLDASRDISEQCGSIGAYLIAASSDRALRDIGRILRKSAGNWRRGRAQLGPDGGRAFTESGVAVEYRIVRDRTYDVMAHSDLLISCSGTATLEAMILGTPMIIVYRGSRAMKIEYLFRKGILEEFIGMPNIVAGRLVCPELLGDQASSEKIAKSTADLLTSPSELQKMRRELQEAKSTLGVPGGTELAAKAVLEAAGLS